MWLEERNLKHPFKTYIFSQQLYNKHTIALKQEILAYTTSMTTVMAYLQRLEGLFFLFLLNTTLSESLTIKSDFFKKNLATCKRLAKHPFFEIDLVLGKPWKVYYSWNLKLDTRCLEISFKNATPRYINRIWSDMRDYLEEQPVWEAATLVLTMGPSNHELLLFADQGPAGSFIAVPNVSREPSLVPARRGVSLMKFHIKLLQQGQYLLFVDCQMGASSLGARLDEPPYRSEIDAVVAGLDLGDGFPACTKERNKEEQVQEK